MHNSAQWAPLKLILASFESGGAHESNDSKISSGAVAGTELRMIWDRAFFPKMWICDQFGFKMTGFGEYVDPEPWLGGPISTPKRCKKRQFWTLFLKNVSLVTFSNVRSCSNQLRKNVCFDLWRFSPQRMPSGRVKKMPTFLGSPFPVAY